MSQRNILNPAVKHIMDNFNIFGFGNEEAALLQSIKELLENSIDSCKAAQSATNPVTRSINIAVSTNSNSNSTIVMDVSDEGCGIEDPTTVLRCFQSSKDSTTNATTLSTGRFGVGLSTCLVYSLLKLGTPMRLITKCKDSLGATVADYSMDQAGNPSCVQNRSVNTNGFVSGTKIRVELPVSQNQETVVKRVTRAVETYLIRLDVLPTTFIATGLSVTVGGFACNLRCSGHDPFLAAVVLQSESMLATRFRDKYNSYLERAPHPNGSSGTSGGTNSSGLSIRGGTAGGSSQQQRRRCSDAAAVVLERADFTVAVVLCVTEATVTTSAAAGLGTAASGSAVPDPGVAAAGTGNTQQHAREAHRNLVPADTLPLQIWRYANHVPLLDYSEDALSCCTSAAVRAVKWGDLGYKLRLSLDSSSDDSSDDPLAQASSAASTPTTTSTAGPAPQLLPLPLLCPAPAWELHVQALQRPELCALLQARQPRITLAVDVIARHVPYANMRKTAIGKDHPALAKLITEGVQAVLAKLESRPCSNHNNNDNDNDDHDGEGVRVDAGDGNGASLLQSLFCSKKHYQARQMREKYLPSIAASVARMVACSQDARYVGRVQRLLQLDTDADAAMDSSDGEESSSDGEEGDSDGTSDHNGSDSESDGEGSARSGHRRLHRRRTGAASAVGGTVRAATREVDQQALRRAIEERLQVLTA